MTNKITKIKEAQLGTPITEKAKQVSLLTKKCMKIIKTFFIINN